MSLLPATIPVRHGGPASHGPLRPHPRTAEKGHGGERSPGNAGRGLLLLGTLAAVLLAVILLLLEAKVILHLGGQLNRDMRFVAPPLAGRPPASRDRPVPEPGTEEERRDDAAG